MEVQTENITLEDKDSDCSKCKSHLIDLQKIMKELDQEKTNSKNSEKLLGESQIEMQRINQVSLFTTYDNVLNHALCVLGPHVY